LLTIVIIHNSDAPLHTFLLNVQGFDWLVTTIKGGES